MLILIICGMYFAIPIWWVVIASTKTPGDLIGTFGLWFSDFEWMHNVVAVFTYNGGIFGRWIINSVMYSVGGAGVATIFASAAGYALSKYWFRGREAIFTVFLCGVMVPPTAVALPLYLLLSGTPIINTYWAVLLPSMVSPFGVYLSRIYASAAVPDELIEAARVDGASEPRIFASIAFRLMTPALVTIFLFQVIAVWNNFLLPLVMLSNEKLYPIILGLNILNQSSRQESNVYTVLVTGAFISVALLVIGIVSLQRFWRGGLTAGSLK
jgi:multiple sugar transport system permease protein